MHTPNPLALARTVQRAWSYFRTGVRLDGSAVFCDQIHPFLFEERKRPQVPQHIDVALRFWASRGEPVTIIDIARAEIISPRLELDDFGTFKSVPLEPGQTPAKVNFQLHPRHEQKAPIEAPVGATLELEFRSSRGSERWARPKISLTLNTTTP